MSAVVPELALGSARGRLALAATVGASGMAMLDATVVNVALPHIGADLHADVERAPVGAHRVPVVPRVADPARRRARRPLRPAADLRDRHGVVRARVAALQRGAEHRDPRGGPGVAGHRRRAAHARKPRDPPGELPRARPRAGGRRVVRTRRRRRCDRPVRRRCARRRPGVALGLPDQPADRRRGHRLRPGGDPRDPGSAFESESRPRRCGTRGRRSVGDDVGAHRGGSTGLDRSGCRRGRRSRGSRRWSCSCCA